ncbi:MAG: tetratricopeptide repeat protein [Okeania sp. SIO3H1]|nr:tetratricopeptide repeat protein [Okeania sp. SIO3H1]
MRIINMVEFCHKQMLKKLSKGLPKSISILIIVLILSISGNSAYSQGTKDKFNDNYQQENDLKLLSAFPKNPNLATHPIDSLLAQNQEQVADFKLKEEISIRVREEVDYTFRHATSLLSIFLILLTLFPASAAIWIWFLQTKLSNKIFMTEQEIESFKYDTISQLKEIVNEAQIILDELQQQSKQADEKIEQLQKDTLIQYSDAKTDNSEPLMMANDYAKQADKFFFAGRLKEAVSAYNQALKIHPEMADTWNNRGVVLTRLKMYDEAIVSYDRALQIRADYADAWNNRGVCLIELQHYQEAINSFEQAIKVKADYADAWNNRGVCLAKIQKYQEAVKSYNQAIAIKNNYSDAWNNRGVALMKLGIYGEAIACYDNAAKIKPDFFSAWYNKARCCVLKGEVEAGLKSLKKAINLNPSRCKEMAKKEPDFDEIRNNELFKKLV